MTNFLRINSIRSRCKTLTLHPPISIWHISFLKIFTNKWIGTTTHNHTLINNLFTLINQKIKTYKINNLFTQPHRRFIQIIHRQVYITFISTISGSTCSKSSTISSQNDIISGSLLFALIFVISNFNITW